ncbi:DUF805 domain-containing protein [Capnocytophaga canimorsus]|uniref:DUF805 domain-containing protein n=1 Tax=Capnocytophaga canimorsus TaxID=28188 RepID=UPI00384E2146
MFKGKISRKEYMLTFASYLGFFFIGAFLDMAKGKVYNNDFIEFSLGVYFVFLLLFTFFLIAQGTKRCHDIGVSGRKQLIPFYFLVLLLTDSKEQEFYSEQITSRDGYPNDYDGGHNHY